MNTIADKRGSGMDYEGIFDLIENNPALHQCQLFNGDCWYGSMYPKFSATMSACIDELLCPKVYITKISLKVYGNNYKDTGKIDECMLYLDKCC